MGYSRFDQIATIDKIDKIATIDHVSDSSNRWDKQDW